jgi:hypothetical protein
MGTNAQKHIIWNVYRHQIDLKKAWTKRIAYGFALFVPMDPHRELSPGSSQG